MKSNLKDNASFKDFMKPIKKLEKAFQSAGIPVEIEFKRTDSHGKVIDVLSKTNPYYRHSVSIEGDSPAQAIKDIAAAIRL
jgi:hypothetical protein